MVLVLLIYKKTMWTVLVACSAHQNVHRNIAWQTERIPKEIQKMKNLERKVSNVQFLVKRCVEILPRNQDQHKKIQTKNWVTK